MTEVVHWHCEWGCQKVVFETINGKLRCVCCGGLAINAPDCECLGQNNEN